jgi:hypothetical protein
MTAYPKGAAGYRMADRRYSNVPEHEIATAIARCAEERAWRRCDYFETADIAAGSAFLMC